MAEIPVEKRSGIPGWVWLLLLLLLLALLAWWLLSDDDDEVETAVVEDDVPAAVVAPAGLMVGETVDWDNVMVTEVTGDMSFMVEHEGNQYPVFFDQTPTPDTPTEGIVDINQGMMVDIDGEVRSATDTLPDGADPSFLGDQENYIFATGIETRNAEI